MQWLARFFTRLLKGTRQKENEPLCPGSELPRSAYFVTHDGRLGVDANAVLQTKRFQQHLDEVRKLRELEESRSRGSSDGEAEGEGMHEGEEG